MDGSPLGATVAWHHISSSAYGGMQTTEGKDAFRKGRCLPASRFPLVFRAGGEEKERIPKEKTSAEEDQQNDQQKEEPSGFAFAFSQFLHAVLTAFLAFLNDNTDSFPWQFLFFACLLRCVAPKLRGKLHRYADKQK